MLNFGFYNMDCLEGLKEFPDKYFNLAIVDPPYGGAGDAGSRGRRFDKYKQDDLIGNVARTGGGTLKNIKKKLSNGTRRRRMIILSNYSELRKM